MVMAVSTEDGPIQPGLERQADGPATRRAFSTEYATITVFWSNCGRLHRPQRAVAQVAQEGGIALFPPQGTAIRASWGKGHPASSASRLLSRLALEKLAAVDANRRGLASCLVDVQWLAHGWYVIDLSLFCCITS
jgi:hypothetical protein